MTKENKTTLTKQKLLDLISDSHEEELDKQLSISDAPKMSLIEMSNHNDNVAAHYQGKREGFYYILEKFLLADEDDAEVRATLATEEIEQVCEEFIANLNKVLTRIRSNND